MSSCDLRRASSKPDIAPSELDGMTHLSRTQLFTQRVHGAKPNTVLSDY